MEIRAFLKGVLGAMASETPQAFAVLTVVCSTVFIATVTFVLWWGALMEIDQNFQLLLKVQLIGVAALFFGYTLSDAEQWRKVLPHKRFAFLSLACGVSPACFIPTLEFAPHLIFLAGGIAWSSVVFFYTRFYFTYKAFCNVSD